MKFITKFTYVAKKDVGSHVNEAIQLEGLTPSTGELYYLRMMLVVVKGPTTYEQIRTVKGRLYSTFIELTGSPPSEESTLMQAAHYMRACSRTNKPVQYQRGHIYKYLIIPRPSTLSFVA